MKKTAEFIASIFLMIFSYSVVFATVRNVPAQYSSITAALIACGAGDTVLVQPGIYTENIVWVAVPGIKLLSAGDSSNTIINGGAVSSVISINVASGVVDTNTEIKGFKITNGMILDNHAYGAGIYLENASPKLENLDISDNHLRTFNWDWGYGAGLYCLNSNPVIRYTIISGNFIDSASWGYGAGIYLTHSAPLLENVIIENNYTVSDSWCFGVGLFATDSSGPVLINVRINGNNSKDSALWYYGGGVYVSQSSINMTNVLITDNRMGAGGYFYEGGGFYLRDASTANLMNVTIAENKKADNSNIYGSGIYNDNSTLVCVNSISWNLNSGDEIGSSTGATNSISYSCIRNGTTGSGNINSNPMLYSNTDFHLQAISPCVDAGTLAGAPLFDLDNNPRPMPAGGSVDMGAYELYQPSSGIAPINVMKAELFLYPNPANDQIYIQYVLSVSGIIQLSIYDVEGREQVILKATLNSGIYHSKLNLNDYNLSPGIYFVKLQIGDERRTVKLSKL